MLYFIPHSYNTDIIEYYPYLKKRVKRTSKINLKLNP